ncbi:hypothetical protein OF117_04255 [Geodermatophilus sp. YIM 151500]|uniref:DUF6541 family protein n=1 Tax=Geodermatophilus sp. YIM 151500 TaxID=2984531 RepID=UPI0021E43DBD|nr:DUF6541 family protein [Geodermatophilus sp. YIM 151500]MCV2488567.1 hypothetical protein [Geodermatophilus sp. YIM 151500]
MAPPDVLLTLTAAVLLLFVPGSLVGIAVGLRGWVAAAAAPLLTCAAVLVAIVVTGLLGVRWSPVALAAVTVVLAVAARALAHRATVRRAPAGRTDGRRGRHSPAAGAPDARVQRAGAPDARVQRAGAPDAEDARTAHTWSLLAVLGTLTGAVVGFLTIVGGTDGLAAPNQGFDALFHVNMVETITRSGEAGPGVASAINGYAEGVSVYPDAFHALASLVAQIGAGTLPAINGLMACLPLVGGVGLVALLRSLGLVREAAVAPVVLAATSGYPVDLVWRGPIWVFVFGITLVPAFLVLLRWSLGERTPAAVAVVGLAAAGLALVHPSAALAAGVFAACLVLPRWLPDRRRVRLDLAVLAPAAVLAGLLALPLIGKAVLAAEGGTVVDWPVAQSVGEAVGELLLYNYENEYPQTWLAVPALAGLVLGWRQAALRWWYTATGIFFVLCVLAAAFDGPLVQALTAPWWNDRYRFEGLVFLGLAVSAAVGLVAAGRGIGGLLRAGVDRWDGRAGRPEAFRVVGTVLAVVVLGVLSGGYYVEENREQLATAYGPDVGGSVGPADRRAFEELAELAGDGPVLNDPNDGSAWMWALAGVRPVFGQALTFPVKPPLPEERQLLVDELNCLDSDEDVRRAIEELGVRYVYQSNATIIAGPTPSVGFRDLDGVDSLRPVFEYRGAAIYEIDPVPLQERPDPVCRVG